MGAEPVTTAAAARPIRREVVEAGSLYGPDCRALVIPAHESVNIDDEADFRRAESMVTS